MPAQKRVLSENPNPDMDESPPQGNLFCRKKPQHEQEELEDEEGDFKNVVIVEEEAAEDVNVEAKEKVKDGVEDCTRRCDDVQKEDSDGSPSSSGEEKTEFIFVELPNIRKDVQCPICLGIIKKTRTVMECLHRFCRECIDKSMRMGNNECPACRTHCPSRRSLRDDPNYDALIAVLYPDIEKYEEEELAFHEEEKNRNKQIQESISLIFQRQEALNKRRSIGKNTSGGGAYLTPTRSQRKNHCKKGRNGRQMGSDDSDYENDVAKNTSSTDDHCMEIIKPRRGRRRRISLPSSSFTNWSDGNDLELGREMFGWGKGGVRSHTRHGIGNVSNNMTARHTRLAKLVDHLRSLDANDDELDVNLMLVSLDERTTPSLLKPYLYCRPSLSVEHLREYIALHTHLKIEEVEILCVPIFSTTLNNPIHVPEALARSKDLQILKGHETLAGLKATCTCNNNQLILAYRLKENLAYS